MSATDGVSHSEALAIRSLGADVEFMTAAPARRLVAVLGPTNTGKTYLAVERMLGYRSGMIGFPLRLLARENYDRVVKLKGPGAVALVTGEERIIPPHPAYFVCTVESMPVDRRIAFLAVDEVQLAADPERGHVFTQRLLYARGEDETMFLGADTIRPLLRRLLPETEIVSRPRFSTLSYAGAKKLTRLPRRSAVVAFSAADVYEIAELMRRQRGGCAVVMGALSPRTRNAQVAMYQAGEVDYLVATDAIGMGLNMDIDHVAFAKLVKFDGRAPRRLAAAEIAQIAGRAGRHMNDGSFGTTAESPALEPEVVEAIENHRFDPLPSLFWRNSQLDFRSLDGLLRSLDRAPPAAGLLRAREADDHAALIALARDPEIAALARAPAALRLLWEVCQIPDFRKTLSDAHARLLGHVYRHLIGPRRVLPTDWVADQIARIDRAEGDIDTLMQRIAHIRTWTYIAHRGDWLDDSRHWQERARGVEDRLSDALHQSLTQRFVDRRHALLTRRLSSGNDLLSAVTASGEVLVEGHAVGRMDGFRFVPESANGPEAARSLMASARRALAREIPARLRRLELAPDDAFRLDAGGFILWHGAAVARLARGDHPLSPRLELFAGELDNGPSRERLRRRLAEWLDGNLRRRLQSLWRAREADLAGAARGLVFQLVAGLGVLPRAAVAAQVAALTAADREALGRIGVHIGRESVWLPGHGRPGVGALKQLLWAAHAERPPPRGGERRLSYRPPPGVPEACCLAGGYRLVAGLAIRIDALERLSKAASLLARHGPFAATEALAASIGCAMDDLGPVLQAIGFRRRAAPGQIVFTAGRRMGSKGRPVGAGDRVRRRMRRCRPPETGESPFSRLAGLKFGK
jgi:ATP-dependent RNA helicase SUPV3L1/SUV3